jgi:aspartyl-tRNA(Asn)/glutamyl-tRNA(Gln) amidotransferase subunit A
LTFAALCGLDAFPGLGEQSLKGIRIGRLAGHFGSPLHTDVRAALESFAGCAQADGACVATIGIEQAGWASAIYFVTVLAEAACEHEERLDRHGARIGTDVRTRLETAAFLPAHWYVKAQRLRTLLSDAMEASFRDVDVLLCPTMRAPAPRTGATHVDIDGRSYPLHSAVSDLTLPFSLTGMPAISIPWGRSGDGAPIGLQVIGNKGQDWMVLEVAHRLEMLRDRVSGPDDRH